MSEFTIARRYARSLLELSKEKGQLAEEYQDMRLLQQVIKSSRDFLLMLRNPVINPDKKIRIVEAIFKDKISPITAAFFKLVTEKRREKYLPEIAGSFIDQYNLLKKIVTATLTTAVPADQAIKDRVIQMVRDATGHEQVDLREKIKPDLIGGYILQFEDKQYDSSIRRYLEKLDDNFLSNIYLKRYN